MSQAHFLVLVPQGQGQGQGRPASARFSRSHATKKSRLQQIRDRKFFIYQQVQTKFLPVLSFMK